MTSLPNLFNHSNQAEAIEFLRRVSPPLLVANCSKYLTHFLCSAAFPLCFPKKLRQIHPCRELCLAVRESCTPILTARGLSWPEELNCNLYSSYVKSICVWTEGNPSCGRDGTTTSGNNVAVVNSISKCTGRLVPLPNVSSTVFGNVSHCTEPCNGVYFDDEQHQVLLIWITALSLVTLLVCVVIFLTYILNFRRVPNLEAPIYYISLCYAILSLFYTISIAIGKESIICEPRYRNRLNESSLLTDSTNKPLCLIIFCVVYYFTLCSWTWWAVCTVQWCVTSVRARNISGKWRLCFHITAWSIPLVFTLAALSLGHVTGDPTIKTCWIEKRYELPYLVSPLFCALVLCSVMLVFCFARIVKLQKSQKLDSESSHLKLNPLILVRVGLYCTLYLVPMGILLCVYFYEYWYRISWEMHYLKCVNSMAGVCATSNSPVFAVFMIKIAATLSMGIASVFWILSRDLVVAWRRVCCFCMNSQPHTNIHVYAANGKHSSNFHLHHTIDDPSNTTSTDSSV